MDWRRHPGAGGFGLGSSLGYTGPFGRARDPFAGSEALRLVVTDPEGFGCRNVPHFAVALDGLDCRVRIAFAGGYCEVSDGKMEMPESERRRASASVYEHVGAGSEIEFRAVGPDAEEAERVIRRTFREGPQDHQAVLRKFARRMKEQL